MRRMAVWCSLLVFAVGLSAVVVSATEAEMYFSTDKNGQNRITDVQEGTEVFIVVYDPDENIDCDVRDKIWTDVKLMDPKTGAYIVWKSYWDAAGDFNDNRYDEPGYVPYKGHWPGTSAGWLGEDYLEETGADTGLFVSKRAFQIGTRESFSSAEPWHHTHVVDVPDNDGNLDEFQWGGYSYADDDAGPHADDRVYYTGGPEPDDVQGYISLGEQADPPSLWRAATTRVYMVGRFENMDSLIGMYQDPNDETDVATGMMKIIDTEATISWDREVYKDANEAATLTIVDPDENLNCNQVEAIPVFILVNPGSWNPIRTDHASTFCGLLRTGGVRGDEGDGNDPGEQQEATPANAPIRWYNIYTSRNAPEFGWNGSDDGRYYLEYDVTLFDTASNGGVTPVSFYAWETGVNTGVFQLNLNSILVDLEFNSLNVRDVLAAYYLDPNDFDDLKIATAYIEERQHSIVSFTDANRADKDLFWIGRDPVYIQVIDSNANVDPCCPEQVVVHVCDPHGEDDSEWLILDETSSNSPVFFTNAGTELDPVWDALGIGLADSNGGFALQLDNWKLEVFNEDSVYVRYNDVYYTTDETGLAGLGDLQANSTADTAFPPRIDRVRVANDVSFDLMEIADTQVFDGETTSMFFLDRQGNRVTGYVNSDCVFIEVIDADQDEDQLRRERIDGFWDGEQNVPFGPMDLNEFVCDFEPELTHRVNHLLGDTNIFNNGDVAKVYVLNPRNGRWAAVDLLETGVATGDFVSVICIDLTNVYTCVPTLGVLPGDTIVAFYQDPSNHSDSAMISIKVGIGGGGTPPSQASTAMFVDANGDEVSAYTDADSIFVKVIDPSHAGVALLEGALTIEGEAFDLRAVEGAANTFQTEGLELSLAAGQALTATYTDPTDPTDVASDTITIIASVLDVEAFFAGPSPFDGECTFGFVGTGVASVFTVEVYDLAGGLVWAQELANVTEIVWNGTDTSGSTLANGAYIYVISATDGTDTFTGEGTVFIAKE